MRQVPWYRKVAMAGAAACLGLGLIGGLSRLGWFGSPLAAGHGPLMMGGFLGALISLERAVALGVGWAYLAPVLAWSGALLATAGWPQGRLLMAFGSLGLVAVCLVLARRRADAASGTMTLGAALWLLGNGLWAGGWSVAEVLPFWLAFPVLTIAGERLELSSLRRLPPGAHGAFGVLVLAISLPPLQGPGLAALGLWLLRFDLAWRTVRLPGRTRYLAICLLSGYAWLLIAGTLMTCHGLPAGGPLRDAILHALLLGFVMSMIFGHALLVFPGVTGLALHYRSWLYGPLACLHLSVAARMAADLGWLERAWAGAGNVAALAAFPATLALIALRRGK